ncbi:hypothetical protein VTJ04DRAFT_1346 [Mycothermus thermophilus]|uniref:uncharacterized protein n=1 Tax=Humicola insolens TaxID=85995 RepID=UPI003742A86E
MGIVVQVYPADMENGLLTSEGKRWCFAGPSKATNRRSRGGCANQEKDDGVGLKAGNGGRGGWEGQNGLKRNGRPRFRLHVTKNQQHGRERVRCWLWFGQWYQADSRSGQGGCWRFCPMRWIERSLLR